MATQHNKTKHRTHTAAEGWTDVFQSSMNNKLWARVCVMDSTWCVYAEWQSHLRECSVLRSVFSSRLEVQQKAQSVSVERRLLSLQSLCCLETWGDKSFPSSFCSFSTTRHWRNLLVFSSRLYSDGFPTFFSANVARPDIFSSLSTRQWFNLSIFNSRKYHSRTVLKDIEYSLMDGVPDACDWLPGVLLRVTSLFNHPDTPDWPDLWNTFFIFFWKLCTPKVVTKFNGNTRAGQQFLAYLTLTHWWHNTKWGKKCYNNVIFKLKFLTTYCRLMTHNEG